MSHSKREPSLLGLRTSLLVALLASASLFGHDAEARQRGKGQSQNAKSSASRDNARGADSDLARPVAEGGQPMRPGNTGFGVNGGQPSNPAQGGQQGTMGPSAQGPSPMNQRSPYQGGQAGQASQPGQMSQPGQASQARQPAQPGQGPSANNPTSGSPSAGRAGGNPGAAGGRPEGAEPVGRTAGGGSNQRSAGDRGDSSGGSNHESASGSQGGSNQGGSNQGGSNQGNSNQGGSNPPRGEAHRDDHHHSSAHGAPPSGGTRSYDRAQGGHERPNHSHDHRYARPDYRHVREVHDAHRPPPGHSYYNGWYSHWYVHPYYRYMHATYVVVSFGFVVNPWVVTWAPPVRAGWSWSGGFYDAYGYWHPGYWAPVRPAPVRASVGYVYVPGWWQGDIYIEGYYRVNERAGWTWDEGYYLADGTYVSGHWQPASAAPQGYTWEAGFFDGETWIEGFWRPEYRSGYTWVSGWYDESGVYQSGYWMPLQQQPGYTWIPGWFDGNRWVEGYWVSEAEYNSADPAGWQAPEGWDDGWGEGAVSTNTSASDDEIPLALPVE